MPHFSVVETPFHLPSGNQLHLNFYIAAMYSQTLRVSFQYGQHFPLFLVLLIYHQTRGAIIDSILL
jgi:hypothetical protein